jgi:ABC-2 type transport system ATP-binding protein
MLFLDEPTSGLDPESVLSVNNMIKDLAVNEGVTVFLCTHQLRYAEEICDAYGLIDAGVLLATGSMDELCSMVFSGITLNVMADRLPPELNAVWSDSGFFQINLRSETEIPEVVRRIVESGGNIYHVSVHRPSLEEVYFALLERRKESEVR